MKSIRKQVLISKWIDNRFKRLAKHYGISYSEMVRIAQILVLAVPGTIREVLDLPDYEHNLRKEMENGKELPLL